MRYIAVVFAFLLINWPSFGQTDDHGNPVFNSISTGEKSLENVLLISNYYTLRNNIENPKSSVFISERLTLEQVENAATHLASEFFILTKNSKMVAIIMLQHKPKREFFTILMATNQTFTFPCHLKGDITEARAMEIVEGNYDPNAAIQDGMLSFNGKSFRIIPGIDIENEVIQLIKKQKIDRKKPSKNVLFSTKELKAYVLKESKEGGKMDYFTEIKGKEYDGVQVKPGVFTTRMSIALYQWGRACFDLGVNTVEDALELFEKHKGRELGQRERDYIRMGFFREWEQK